MEEADEAGYICRLPGSPSQLEPVTGGVVGLVGVVRPPVGGAATPLGESLGAQGHFQATTELPALLIPSCASSQ